MTDEKTVVETEAVETEVQKPSYEELEVQLAEWKTNSRRHEDKFKSLKEKAESWEAYEASQKSEAEKVAEELETYKARAAKAEQELTVSSIISEMKLPANLTKHLKGSTREELEASAKELLEDFGVVSTQTESTETKTETPKAKAPVDKNLGAPVTVKVSNEGGLAAALREAW